MTPGDVAGGPLDVPTLEVIGRRASTHGLVDSWQFQPDGLSPRHVEIRLDPAQYPPAVDAARLDVRWYEGGEFAVHYVESRGADRWQCRWDRHQKPGAPTAHFHPLPDAGADVDPSPLDDTHHLAVLFDVLDWVSDRIGRLHGDSG